MSSRNHRLPTLVLSFLVILALAGTACGSSDDGAVDDASASEPSDITAEVSNEGDQSEEPDTASEPTTVAEEESAPTPPSETTVAVEEPTTAPADPTEESEPTDAEPPDSEPESAALADMVNDTTAGVQAAQWSSNVSIEFGTDTFTFTSDSRPSHELPDQFLIPSGNPGDGNPTFEAVDTDTLIPAVELVVELPLNPVYSNEPTDIPLGQGAVIISGAQLYNDFEDMERSVVAVEDQTVIDGVGFLDACNGHPLASGFNYHYHGIPYCVTDAVDIAGQHSTIVGFILDGFPLYGNKDEGGVEITNADLDECSGHFGPTPEFPDGIYHYHLTDDAAPYSINCYHGVIEVVSGPGAPGGGGGGGGGGQGPPPEDGDRPPRPEGGPPADGQGPPEGRPEDQDS